MDKLNELAELMFPQIDKSIDDWELQYPERDLLEGQVVTRIAPSPTGNMHTGGVYSALINQSFTKQRGGVFFLRIEDTDQKRLKSGAVEDIVDTLKNFEIYFDEGALNNDDYNGEYGPYRQTLRKEIYQTYIKELVRKGLAYPCFCTEEELKEMHEKQEQEKSSLRGYGGKYAKCRFLSTDEAIRRIKAGDSFTVHLKAPELQNDRIVVNDLIRGELNMEANKIDVVIMKSNGLPTYHFAHVIDDHLMHTTHVIRGDEWISSTPLHIQMFKTLGFKVPKYAHFSPLRKMEGTKRRKISKRKDPEARASYYFEEGYPIQAVKEYLMNIINSGFEEWREKNPQLPMEAFKMKLGDIGKAGALFDMQKLTNTSKKIIKNLSDEIIVQEILKWAQIQSPQFYDYISKNRERFANSITIWHQNRMDVAKWRDVETQYPYLYNDNFADTLKLENIDYNLPHAKDILQDYLATFDIKDEQSQWFDKIKEIAPKYNYAVKPKDYKNNPEEYNGSIIEVSTIIRQALTGQKDSPDIYKISQFLGEEEVKKRINKILKLM